MSPTSGNASGLRPLDQTPAGRMMIQYGPAEGAQIAENPPRFTWLPEIDDGAAFVLKITGDGGEQIYEGIPLNFFTPPDVMSAGEYSWQYAIWADGKQTTGWSDARAFTVGHDLPKTPLALRKDRLADANLARPRLWLGPDELAGFRKAVAKDSDHCAWANFVEKSVNPWAGKPPMAEPTGYPNDTRVAPIWRQTYIDCQELIYAIRHLAVAGHVLEDDAHLATAKDWLLAASTWNPDGGHRHSAIAGRVGQRG